MLVIINDKGGFDVAGFYQDVARRDTLCIRLYKWPAGGGGVDSTPQSVVICFLDIYIGVDGNDGVAVLAKDAVASSPSGAQANKVATAASRTSPADLSLCNVMSSPTVRRRIPAISARSL